ncbi:hypothetical protein JCM12141A_52710 [Mycolicibacterium hodleri]
MAAKETPSAEDTDGRATDGAPTATETGAANAPNTIPTRRAEIAGGRSGEPAVGSEILVPEPGADRLDVFGLEFQR